MAVLLPLTRWRHLCALLLGVGVIACFPAPAPLATDAEPWPCCVEDLVARTTPATVERSAMVRLRSGLVLWLRSADPPPAVGARILAQGVLAPDAGSLRCTEALLVLNPQPMEFAALMLRWADRVGERLQRDLSPDAARLLRALLLGDSSIDADLRNQLARTGTLHLFAISGMHLVLLMGLARRVVGLRRALLAVLVLFYAALCGFATPILRAFLSTALLLCAGLLHRPAQGTRHLLLALAVVLFIWPEVRNTPGFWLTFAATAGILWAIKAEERRDPPHCAGNPAQLASWGLRLLAAARTNLRVSLCACTASAPVTAVFFCQVTPAAIPGTLLLSPIVTLLMVLALFKLAWPDAPALCLVIEMLLHGIEALVAALDQLPLGNLALTPPSFLGWCGVAVSLLVLCRLRRRWSPLLACALMHCALLLPAAPVPRWILVATPEGPSVLTAEGRTARVIYGTVPENSPELRRLGVLHVEPQPQRPWPPPAAPLFPARGDAPMPCAADAVLLCTKPRRTLHDALRAAAAGLPLQNARRGRPLAIEHPAAPETQR